ncbi:MAG TPA: XrtA system polysaccharide chain length determinant [Burkholderiaceae bacterium]|nr:XrtA system polysaccharide chain length determinant [Burkholderiaceae bacterium]
MDEILRQIVVIARGMWQRRWIGVAVAWLVAIAGAAVLMRVPDRYEASARIFVDTQSVLKPLMAGLTVQPDINQQVAMLARTLITRPNVEKLVREADLSILIKNERDREALIDALMREIKLTGGGRENLYNVTYRDTDKGRAQRVVQTLTNMFVDSGLGSKRRDTEAARRFIDEQIKAYEKKLEEAEARLKEFKLRNLAYTTGTGQDYFARMAAANEELARAKLELRAAEQSRDALKRGLGDEEPVLLPDPGPVPIGVPELDSRIDLLRKQLDEQLRRFTEEHPDVAATRRLLVQLEEQRRTEIEARKRAAASRPQAAPTNPVFQRIKIALAEADATVASLRGRVTELQSRVDQLRAAAGRVPQIEAELAQLNRDYDVLRKNYDALVARRESASISEDVDASAQLAEFRIIDPPRVSPQPVFPSRATLAPLALLAAIAAGVLASFAIAQLFPTILSARTLREIGKRPVLGTISLRLDAAALRRKRIANFAFGGAVSALMLVFGAWSAWIAMTARG